MEKKKTKRMISRNPEEIAKALGLDKSVAVEWQVRHEVNSRIIEVFEKSEMTITSLAKRAETSRARITRILKQDIADLARRTDLEEETIEDVMRILKEEFEN